MKPIDMLDQAIREGTVIRHEWVRYVNRGRERACLLASMVPECGRFQTADACPASVMPPWLAHLTPWIDDAGTDEQWWAVVHEYAELLRASEDFTPGQWARLKRAMSDVISEEVLAVRKVVLEYPYSNGYRNAVESMARDVSSYLRGAGASYLKDATAYAVSMMATLGTLQAVPTSSGRIADRIIRKLFAAWAAEVERSRPKPIAPVPEMGKASVVQDAAPSQAPRAEEVES